MEIETIALRTISEDDAQGIAELIVSIWPKPGRSVESFTEEILRQGTEYQGPQRQEPRSFLIREGGRVIAHSGAAPRTIRTPQGDITVLALARVCTDPAVRGRKLGDAVVRATLALVDRGEFPFSLFQTSDDVRPFYERLGAVVVDNRFVNSLADDPIADPFWAPVRMRYPSTGDWPEGEIDLRGPGW